MDESYEISEEEIDPMNSPISELLKARADERRRKMKDFNYKFNTCQNRRNRKGTCLQTTRCEFRRMLSILQKPKLQECLLVQMKTTIFN